MADRTSAIAREGKGFLSSPFEDPVFRRIAAVHGFEDDGREWPDGVPGFNSREDPDMPAGMPRFTFSRGTEPYDGCLSIDLGGIGSYLHSSLSFPHIAMRRDALPETMWSALAGRPATDLIDHEGLAGMTIEIAESRWAGDGRTLFCDIKLDGGAPWPR